MADDLQDIKNEMAGIVTRLGNVEGYFGNFDTTLNNHMTDYKKKQESIDKTVSGVEGKLKWGFWVIFGMLTMVMGGFVAIAVMLLDRFLQPVASLIGG